MNILYIANAIPSGRLTGKDGFSVSHGAIRALAGNKNKITLIALSDLSEEDLRKKADMEGLCDEVILVRRKAYGRLSHRLMRAYSFLKNTFLGDYKCYSSEMKVRLQGLDEPSRFDIAIYDNFYLVQYAGCIKRLPKVLYLMDSMALRAQEMLKSAVLEPFNRLELLRTSSKIRNFERDNYGNFLKIIVVANEDKGTILNLNSGLKIDVLPLSVDTDYFKRGPSGDGNAILFMGVLWAEHNADAAYCFCKEILPLIRKRNKTALLMLVGGVLRDEIRKAAMRYQPVEIAGLLEDVRPYLDKTAVFVSPMRIGSGMNNKLLEAMSMGKAIVTTAHGNRGIDLKNGFEAVVSDDKDEFADAVIDLLEKREKRDFLGANARKKAEERFSFGAYARKLQEIIERAASG